MPADIYSVEESVRWKEWTKDPSLADEFHKVILEHNKDLYMVSLTLKKPIGFCLWYYYNKYKPSDNYKVLKAHIKKLQLEQNRNDDECAVCDDGGGESNRIIFIGILMICIRPKYLPTFRCSTELICCDFCPNAYHPRCLGLDNLASLDDNDSWSCPRCVRQRTESCRSPVKSPRKSYALDSSSPVVAKPEQLLSSRLFSYGLEDHTNTARYDYGDRQVNISWQHYKQFVPFSFITYRLPQIFITKRSC